MNEYPTAEEEFEAMYADELDAMRELEDISDEPPIPKSKSAKTLNFEKSEQIKVLQDISIPSTSKTRDFDHDFTPLTYNDDLQQTQHSVAQPILSQIEIFDPPNASQERSGDKRSLHAIFGDISDLMDEYDDPNLPRPKRLKHAKEDNHEEEFALIDYIIELRRLKKEKLDPALTFSKNYKKSTAYNLRDNLSYVVPKYSSVCVTKHTGEKVYVRCHSELFEKEERERLLASLSFNGLFGNSFKDVWKEAREIEDKRVMANEKDKIEEETVTEINSEDKNSQLWVDLYKPKRYIELLSDESTNRIMLKWLKLWDKVVFKRRPKVQKRSSDTFQRYELNTELDEHGRPHHKIALLCGPPGLGKTTLAHMIARHAGYKVIEVNASDERSADSFKMALDNATQMSSVIDREKRPNCLVFDEIDGAPPSSIDFLIKYATGAHTAKAKKGKKSKATVLKRPIICICNDVYVPALRNLRQVAFVVHFPSTSTQRLVTRLQEICTKEQIEAHSTALMALAEKSNNDIRSCLSVLHFYKSSNRPLTLSEVQKVNVGQKDVQKGLFTVWQDIFQIERPKIKDEIVSLDNRWKKVLSTISSFGDYERVAQGIFENYPKMNIKDTSFKGTCEALEWFCYSDTVQTKILTLQNYSLSSYLQFAFIVWHYAFSSMQRPKISYPSKGAEVRGKVVKNKAIVTEVLKGMKPSIRAYTNCSSVTLDILPLLTKIITPNLRPVHLHLYTAQEKELFNRIVNIMIDYSLNYVQERNLEGTYVYTIDPNIDDVIKFTISKDKRILTYSNRQLIAREIDIEKMRRVETAKTGNSKPGEKVKEAMKPPVTVPNHLQKLKPKCVKKSSGVGPKNFFLLSKPQDQEKETDDEPSISTDIYYNFKEGHTNAVRKQIKISSLL